MASGKKLNGPDSSVAGMLENVLGCKWSLTILDLVRKGVCRPGAMQRAVPGLSAKVMNERLAKLCRYGVLQKVSYPEIPPRVEYGLTAFGRRFVAILNQIEDLDRDRGERHRGDRDRGDQEGAQTPRSRSV